MNKVFIYQCSWQEKKMLIFCQANLCMRPPSAMLIYLYFVFATSHNDSSPECAPHTSPRHARGLFLHTFTVGCSTCTFAIAVL